MKETIRKIFTLLMLVVLVTVALPQVQTSAKTTECSYHFPHAASLNYSGVQPTQEEWNTVMSKSQAALSFLGPFWSRELYRQDVRFTPPGVQINYQAMAHYDPNTNVINFNPLFFVEQMRSARRELHTDGDMAFITILAHEYGHAVQAQLGWLDGLSINVELQADTMAGVFTRAASNLLEAGDEDEATKVLLDGRDPTGTSPYHPAAHGTGLQRLNAFLKGYRGGVRSFFR